MLKRLKEFLYFYFKDEGGWMVMAGMAAASVLAANSQRNAQMEAKTADAKLQRARLQAARVNATDTYRTNMQRARQATQKRELAIEESRLNAESNLASTFAGSGISGQSVNELDDEIEAEVARNKYENTTALDTQLSDMTRQYTGTMNDTADQAASIDTTAVEGSFLGDAMTAVSAASSVQGLDSKLGNTKIGKSLRL